MDLERERERLLERDAEWAALSSKGQDVDRILSFWTDDARVFAPGLPAFIGKAALRRYVEGALAIPGFQITWTHIGSEPLARRKVGLSAEHQLRHDGGAGGAAGDDQWSCRDGVAPRVGRELALRCGHLERVTRDALISNATRTRRAPCAAGARLEAAGAPDRVDSVLDR